MTEKFGMEVIRETKFEGYTWGILAQNMFHMELPCRSILNKCEQKPSLFTNLKHKGFPQQMCIR